MQAADTVYEFGSSPDEDDDNNADPSSNKPKNTSKKKGSLVENRQQYDQSTSGAAPTTTSSTSIDHRVNTSFSSISDSHRAPNNSQNTKSPLPNHRQVEQQHSSTGGFNDLTTSEELISLKSERAVVASGVNSGGPTGGLSSSNLVGVSSISNTSNTSLTSSATNSSRGNVSQAGNQSSLGGASSQRSIIGHQQSSSSQQQNPNFDSNVISERVKNLATQIYQEFKIIISRCNYDENILSGLMPLIVRVLESLDLALIENQQLQVELELCKDDNEQLVIMFEREKAAKRAIDKKLIESEYAYEEERQLYQQKIESLDNVVKMYELKAKNASDQATRFEEKETERKREYQKLHDRYTELLKSHCDVVERFRHLAGNSEVANLGSINVPQQMVASSSDLTVGDFHSHSLNKLKLTKDDEFSDRTGTLKASSALRSWNPDTELTLEDASLVVIDDMVGSDHHNKSGGDISSHNESDRATTSEPDGEHEKESENDSIAYTSMEKEFRKLIQENKDLLNTKNALNVVKDDLIAEVDRLTNEVSMYEQAVEQLNSTKDQMKQKVSALDAELRKTKEELEKAKQKIRENNEEGVPYSQRKRFGRAEMAKVLMERNNYKERFMELQDAVRYTELVRANRMETEKRSGLWKFFSNLFGAPPPMMPPSRAILGSPTTSSPVIQYSGSATGAGGSGSATLANPGDAGAAIDALQAAAVSSAAVGGSIRSTNQRLSNNADMIVLMDSDLNVDRSRASGRAGVCGPDTSGYIHAYGWSMRASTIRGISSGAGGAGSGDSPTLETSPKFSHILGGTSSHVTGELGATANEQSVSFSGNKLAELQVPIPQYCRPLTGDLLGMKIWCATAIDLSGGDLNKMADSNVRNQESASSSLSSMEYRGPDSSGSVVNISTSTPVKSPSQQQALRQLEREVNEALGGTAHESAIDDGSARRPVLKTTTEMVLNALPYAEDAEELSTCVWICSTQHSRSKINIIDIKTKPNELLDSFYVPTFLYCIKSIPGCKPSDLLGLPNTQVAAETGQDNQAINSRATHRIIDELISTQREEFYTLVRVNPDAEQRLRRGRLETNKQSASGEGHISISAAEVSDLGRTKQQQSAEDDAEISRILDNNVSDSIMTLQKLNDFVAHTQPQHDAQMTQATLPQEVQSSNQDCKKPEDSAYYQPISTHLPTVWMGGKDSVLYVHSAIGQWKDCVACIELRDSILQICHYRGRAFVSLADGSLCVFFRNIDTKQWDFSQYLQVNIGLLAEATSDSTDELQDGLDHSSALSTIDIHSKLIASQQNSSHLTADKIDLDSSDKLAKQSRASAPRKPTKIAGVHCLEIANKNLWLGHRNRVLVFDPITMKLKHTFNVVPQVDNQIRQLISMKDGVFICLRSDLTLRLYSSLRPYQHIQNIDIEPVVTRLISPKTFVISHITAMRVVENTLWIGIAHGIILTIPCKLLPQISEAPIRNKHNGQFEESPSHLSIARFVPKCDLNQAQISFHGHRDAVKFFVHAHQLIVSGGQGYLDFRLDMDDQPKAISDKSHLILWQLPS